MIADSLDDPHGKLCASVVAFSMPANWLCCVRTDRITLVVDIPSHVLYLAISTAHI